VKLPDWDPELYRRFAAERAAPFWDLFALIATEPVASMVDLGCGDGELTAEATRRVGCATVGVDSSSAMLAQARERVTPSLSFEKGDIATWTAVADHDLVFANASLHWVPDHAGVLARWTAALTPGGQLAVQVPANGDHPSHYIADEIGRSEPFLSVLGGNPPVNPTAVNVLRSEEYAGLLHQLGFEEQHVRLQVYPHCLASSREVVEWVRGTNLTRFFKRLPADLHEPFVDAYRTALLQKIGDVAPYFYAFKRILMWGRLA
jgi:trans-aconitate 2-methyltransferase